MSSKPQPAVARSGTGTNLNAGSGEARKSRLLPLLIVGIGVVGAIVLFLFHPPHGLQWIPHCVNILIFLFTGTLFFTLRDPSVLPGRWRPSRIEFDDQKNFLGTALLLLGFRSVGGLIIQASLLGLAWNGTRDTLQWTRPLIVVGDIVAVTNLSAWIVVLRGTAVGLWRAMLLALLAAVVTDLYLFEFSHQSQLQYSDLVVSGVLHPLIFGTAVIACAYRYRQKGAILALAFAFQGFTTIWAYQHIGGSAPIASENIYYAIGACELIIALLVYELFRHPLERENTIKVLNVDRVVALTALLLALNDHRDFVQKFAGFSAIVIAVALLAVFLAFRQQINVPQPSVEKPVKIEVKQEREGRLA